MHRSNEMRVIGASNRDAPHPADVLDRIAVLIDRRGGEHYRGQAFRRAADAVRPLGVDDLRRLAAADQLSSLRGVGRVSESIIRDALEGRTPTYLADLEHAAANTVDPGELIRSALRGDLHVHSRWSDGGATIREMAERAVALGHAYLAMTDHSPRLTVARGLTAERLRQQVEAVATLNEELAPFRILTGIEVDILDDGTLDQTPDLLSTLDVVVASVHSKLRMDRAAMTDRLLAAIENPNVDIIGHITGRIVTGKGRPESQFDPVAVVAHCVAHGKAIEINCRPERRDPPSELLSLIAHQRCRVAVSTDAHAVNQLEWQSLGCRRAAAAGVALDDIVNTAPTEALLHWTATHQRSDVAPRST